MSPLLQELRSALAGAMDEIVILINFDATAASVFNLLNDAVTCLLSSVAYWADVNEQ